MTRTIRKIILASQFLTILPVKDMGETSPEEMGKTTSAFPFVGFWEGVLLTFSASVFMEFFPAELTSALLVLILVIMNGGLHLDGLSDTFDALASGGDSENKLTVMRDSAVGPLGVVSIVMVLLLKYVLLNALFFHTPPPVYSSVVVSLPILSRWTMVVAAFHGRPARGDGLGKLFLEHTGVKQFVVATVAALLLTGMVCTVVVQFPLYIFYLMFAIPVLYGFSFMAVLFCNRVFGGMTGDTFGAVNEIAVLIFILTTVIWAQQFIS
jgi:adenosylcobinamide-GDP ribazoletransferase